MEFSCHFIKFSFLYQVHTIGYSIYIKKSGGCILTLHNEIKKPRKGYSHCLIKNKTNKKK